MNQLQLSVEVRLQRVLVLQDLVFQPGSSIYTVNRQCVLAVPASPALQTAAPWKAENCVLSPCRCWSHPGRHISDAKIKSGNWDTVRVFRTAHCFRSEFLCCSNALLIPVCKVGYLLHFIMLFCFMSSQKNKCFVG